VRIKKAQQDDVNVKRISDLAETRKINRYVMKGGILFEEIDDDLRIVVPASLRTQVVRQAHERGHFLVAKIDVVKSRVLNSEY
jgi:hypothetical protein